ncbi:glycosyltransferase [Candidatus Saccharibacteria bacterium]|nr:glycosyltransferase [Candidatus Saccharibacteria bacterium]
MKIAIFSDCYLDLTGGIVSSINAQKIALEDLGHTVYVFSTSYPKSRQEKDNLAKHNIFPVPSCRFLFRGLTPVSRRPRIIEKWLSKNHPEIKSFDIFYIHYESGCSIAGLRLGKKWRIPTVQVMHGREDAGGANIIPFGFRTIVAFALNKIHSWYLPHRTKMIPDKRLGNTIAATKMWELMVNHANSADLVLTPSAHFRNKLSYYGVNRPIRVFPNGFPDRNFPAKVHPKSFHSGQTLRIIWHSRLSGEKRIMVFLRALTKVTGRYQLDVYGTGPDSKKARRYAKRHHLNVIFHGNTAFNKVQSAIAKSHLDVLVSYNFDTFGMTLIEAEAHGVPVLFCDPDMAEVIPRRSFIQSADESAEGIASAINDLFTHPEKIQSMSTVMLKYRGNTLISKRIRTLEKIFRILTRAKDKSSRARMNNEQSQ